MRKNRIISPSLLSADFSRLAEEIKDVENAGAVRLHLDVMDGHFVPNITFGPLIVKAVRKLTNGILDCHLMIKQPDKYLDKFIEAGADSIILHLEVSCDLVSELNKIKKSGCSAGVSLNPDTPVEKLNPYLDIVDQILVMSVRPGFSGQKFIDRVLPKIPYLVEHRQNRDFIISVDGGVNLTTIADVFHAGADMAVVGSGLFSAGDRAKRYKELVNA